MQGDFERMTFDPTDAFANVLLQQGRLLMPADFNELGAILQDALRQFIVDTQGRNWPVSTGIPSGVPNEFFNGFEIVGITGKKALEFNIKAGRIYVDGIRCENPSDLAYGDPQPFWRSPDDLGSLVDFAIIYLHCWERHVTWLQNGRLRDVALGGPDTATRVQVVWQVRAESTALANELSGIGDALNASAGKDPALNDRVKALRGLEALFTKGMTVTKADEVLRKAEEALREIDTGAPARLAADAKQDEPNPDPCAIASDAEYRGRENQLYRVEVHEPGTAKNATLKWSRENGSVAFRVLDAVGEDTDKDVHVTVTLESLGHDRRTGVVEGDWVELIDDDLELDWTVAPLLQIRNIDVQRRIVTLKGRGKGKATRLPDPSKHAILRRWDHRADNETTGALAVDEKKWIELERGIKIRFESGGYYRKGDYWLIPARVATGDIEWPTTQAGDPRAMEPHGIKHHRAVLQVVTKSTGTWKDV